VEVQTVAVWAKVEDGTETDLLSFKLVGAIESEGEDPDVSVLISIGFTGVVLC